MFKTILLVIALFLHQINNAQSDPARMFENLFTCLQQSDSSGFVKLHVGSEQLFQITKGIILGDLQLDSIKAAGNIPNSRGADSFYTSKFSTLKKKTDTLGINLIQSNYINCRYQLVKNPENFFVSLSGDLIFKENSNYYILPVNEAILISEYWTIISTGSISIIEDTSLLQTKRVSALQTIEKETKISKVRISKVEENYVPPPPPKIIRSKPKSKNK